MKPHLEALKGYGITSLIDIGAAHGHFSMMFDNVFGASAVTMIEANPLSVADLRLTLPQWNTVHAVLGKAGPALFYTNPDEPKGGGSSLYREDTEWFSDAEAVEVEVMSLDDLDVSADFIKIDVQGAEYDIIKYAPKTISNAKFLCLELSFLEYNKGAPLIDDVLGIARELGFRMIDTFGPMKGGHWYKRRKNQVDVLLAKDTLDVFKLPA